MLEKLKASKWGKRVLKLGGIYVLVEVILALSAIYFVGQVSL